MASTIQYTELPERAKKAIENFLPDEDAVSKRMKDFQNTEPRPADKEGDTETLDGVEFTHRFASAPGDYEEVELHYVTCGKPDGSAIVFLHGIPDSWYQWHHQMASLAGSHYCVGVDLKGYGQSTKQPGSYVHEIVAEQLYALLIKILPTPKKCYLVTHDRGTVQGDFISAKHPEFVLGYARGEQHLYHFNPVLAPQHEIFMNAPYSGMMEDTKRFVLFVYTWITTKPIPHPEMERVIQEFSYPGIVRTVPRYFMSSNFRQEWLARRQGGWTQLDGTTAKVGLLETWKMPVVIMYVLSWAFDSPETFLITFKNIRQGSDSKTQPREFYEKSREYIPNARAVEVRPIPGGHFWTLESPEETTEAIKRLIDLVESK